MINILLFLACGDEVAEQKPSVSEKTQEDKKEQPAKTEALPSYEPIQDPLEGGPYPGLLVTQAWFRTGPSNKPIPGPARLEIWRDQGTSWSMTRVEDPDSNVFHKAIPFDDGILTIGAEKALLKKWMFKEGKWAQETLWEQSWGGKFDRLRDIEIGDVDGDGKDELVIATHDAGVVAVLHPDEKVSGSIRVEEFDQKADTFVHEIEIGDVDGDGLNEFFATPTDRNKASASQGGLMVMYKWNGSKFDRTVVDPFGKTHAKEILATDLDGDGRSELFSVVEAEAIGKTIIQPVEIRQYTLNKDGSFTPTRIATIEDRQTRFLVPGDFDNDGKVELIAAAMKSGLWMLDQQDSGVWQTVLIDGKSSGFEHTSYGADLNKDGKLELYVAADEQGQLNQYVWSGSEFTKTTIGSIPERTITWNIVSGEF
ncbi:MAG: hypothetical protein CMK59_11850 [Proteobacteria bacterium]|nr:hypothetical protein [Pseudomonadota bacterium]